MHLVAQSVARFSGTPTLALTAAQSNQWPVDQGNIDILILLI